MGVLIQSAWAMLRRRLARPVREAAVREILSRQAGIAAIGPVALASDRSGRRQVSVRIRFTEGSDARETTRRAVEALSEALPITEIRVFALDAKEAPNGQTTRGALRP